MDSKLKRQYTFVDLIENSHQYSWMHPRKVISLEIGTCVYFCTRTSVVLEAAGFFGAVSCDFRSNSSWLDLPPACWGLLTFLHRYSTFPWDPCVILLLAVGYGSPPRPITYIQSHIRGIRFLPLPPAESVGPLLFWAVGDIFCGVAPSSKLKTPRAAQRASVTKIWVTWKHEDASLSPFFSLLKLF